MENIRQIIDDELLRIEPTKRTTAVIGLRHDEFEQFTLTGSYYWDATAGQTVKSSNGQAIYDGHPVIRLSTIQEPFVIYTEANRTQEVTDYLARD